MCLAIYLASANELPLIEYPDYPPSLFSSEEWLEKVARFYTMELGKSEQLVANHFSNQKIVYAGSYTGCSCGFNYGREYPSFEDDEDHLRAAQESVNMLVAYIQDNEVLELYSCWEGDQNAPKESERTLPVVLATISIRPHFSREKQPR